MSGFRIPFNRACLAGSETDYIARAVENGFISGNGPFCRECERLLERHLPGARVLLTPSCTHALEMAAMLLDIRPGDEVIVPSFTFVSTALAFASRGAKPVFCDSRPDTLNLDEKLLPEIVTGRTRAVVAMHYGGVACEMDAIRSLTLEHGLALVEDNAHGLFGTYRGRPLGTFGSLAAHSFHETKNITCGEGGALAVNDASLVDRALVMRDKGTDRSRFLEGLVDKYTWVDTGSSYVLSDLLGAFLLAQLENASVFQEKRLRIWRRYMEGLSEWAGSSGVGLPAVPEGCAHPGHLFHLMMPDGAARRRLIGYLAERGIMAVFHYQPLHLSSMGRSFGGRPGQCPVAESAGDRLVRLPFFASLSAGDQDDVIEAVISSRAVL